MENQFADALGPSLKTFTLGPFGMSAFSPISDSHFDESHALWLRRFAETAVLQKAVLETIVVDFNPTCSTRGGDLGHSLHLLDDIRDQILKPSGRNIRCDRPVLSEEEWCKFFQWPCVKVQRVPD